MSRTPLLARQFTPTEAYTMKPRPGKPRAGHGPEIRRPARAARLGIAGKKMRQLFLCRSLAAGNIDQPTVDQMRS